MTVRHAPRGPTTGAAGRPRPTGRRRRGPLGTTLLVMLAVVVIGGIVADVLTDVWWYDSVGFRDVFVKELTTKVGHLRRRRRLLTGGGRGLEPGHRLPHPPALHPGHPGPAGARAVPPGHRAAAPDRRVGGARSCSGCSPGPGRWAPGAPSCSGSTAQPFGIKDPQFGLDVGFFVFTLPWLRLRRQLPDRRARPGVRRRGLHPLRLRRPPAARPRADHARRLRAPRHPRRPHRAHPRRVVLARPLLAVDPEGLAAHRHHLHRRPRRAARRRRILAVAARDVRRLLPRRDLEPQLAAADHRRRAARRHRRRRRRHLPGADPVAQGQPVGRSRSRRSTSSATSTPPGRRSASTGSSASRTRRRAETEDKAVLRRRRQRHPGRAHHRPQRRRAHVPPARRPSATTTRSPTPSTSTATPIDKQTRDAVVAVREINLERPARRPAQLAQRPHRLHARLRLLRGLRQPAHHRGRPGLLRGRRPAARIGEYEPRDLLRRAVAGLLRRRRRAGCPAARVRLPRRRRGRRRRAATPTPATAVCRSARRCAGSPTRSSTARPTSCSRMP